MNKNYICIIRAAVNQAEGGNERVLKPGGMSQKSNELINK